MLQPIVYENIVDGHLTNTTGDMWFYDSDPNISGYDTVFFDYMGDGDYSSPYDWGAQDLRNGQTEYFFNA